MDYIMQHLWAAGYDLPPEPRIKAEQPKRRGKKAARAKRKRVGK